MQIFYLQQYFCTLCAIMTQTILDAQLFTYVIILNGYLDILSYALINLRQTTGENNNFLLQKRIKQSVIYHERIVEMVNILQQHWMWHALIHGFGNTGMICTMLYIIPVSNSP